ncbi:type II toxin-antitoxin system VapC family toxin [Lacipirellula sp.]|uniref:type II toxin-antitoxin system VapC family toxin n=1 Tax=Lacipirellula sp. TaxID=2691419 RepID=UPI003D09CCBC
MSPVFLDTSGLIAVVNADDSMRADALQVWHRLIAARVPLITTSLVLVELGDGLSRVRLRHLAIETRRRLLESPTCDVIQVTLELEAEGWDLFVNRNDKSWGVTDCISMVVAKERSATSVFTSDRHFEQAGFEVLLRQP